MPRIQPDIGGPADALKVTSGVVPALEARLVDAAGAAGLLGISVVMFLRKVEPELARIKIGPSFRYDRRDLDAWISAHKTVGQETARATSEFLTLSETARHLRVTVRTLSRWESEGRITGVKFTPAKQGRKVFRRSEVERFLREAEGE